MKPKRIRFILYLSWYTIVATLAVAVWSMIGRVDGVLTLADVLVAVLVFLPYTLIGGGLAPVVVRTILAEVGEPAEVEGEDDA